MPVIHKSRTGKTYYLHSGPKRGGGVQHFFSTKSAGNLVENLPPEFEIYETVNGQVYLRRQQPQLIHNEERDLIVRPLEKRPVGPRYKVEVRGDTLTIHESTQDFDGMRKRFPQISDSAFEAVNKESRGYQAVLRFILVDAERRLFAPERFCFRGSVDDWISIGPAEPIKRLAAQYLKHLGKDSLFELF